ncbi:tRNA preQ1(34) S-adenosylmethionine ribosyltransferase-isomerase QueA [Planctomycetota bacterium]
MKTDKLQYDLPAELIAQQPAKRRTDSRLLVLDRAKDKLIDSRFSRIAEFLSPGDCLVLNDTKVLQARFFARRNSGAKLEGLFLKEQNKGTWQVYLKGAVRVKLNEAILFKYKNNEDFCRAVVLEKNDDGTVLLELQTDKGLEVVLEKIGFAPLPPYIKRNNDLKAAAADKNRYQTVYARRAGAIAAPTAGLHFTKKLIRSLQQKGLHFSHITLHVGMGTFKPITTENLEDHKIHSERFCLNSKNAAVINTARRKGGRIITVGTTSVRTLETVASGSRVKKAAGQTSLFITPGYKFKITDALLTNFHLPKSTLLALVAAFAGTEQILKAYRYAVSQRYRFYSYGDAMLIL